MSLDVSLYSETPIKKTASSGIFIRENGRTIEITDEEWNLRNPDTPAVKFQAEETETDCVYSANITHNLGKMATAVGIYRHLWRPEELGIIKAKDLIEPLRVGLLTLQATSKTFKRKLQSIQWMGYLRRFY